ncbi:hypothetical protein CALCODRAFT_348597 [Calocera cornea HHB12733]|uniref:Uncharacterized protein n=1 Tax=Calocera cornea HHB12733 TaxID=1353952 RepID=A0A165JDB2_9BASI|nr:hypothetical protein CALCODRAFT_348597 [Calocera cornea HHB12733]
MRVLHGPAALQTIHNDMQCSHDVVAQPRMRRAPCCFGCIASRGEVVHGDRFPDEEITSSRCSYRPIHHLTMRRSNGCSECVGSRPERYMNADYSSDEQLFTPFVDDRYKWKSLTRWPFRERSVAGTRHKCGQCRHQSRSVTYEERNFKEAIV